MDKLQKLYLIREKYLNQDKKIFHRLYLIYLNNKMNTLIARYAREQADKVYEELYLTLQKIFNTTSE